jgi:uncharacterized membrane protein
MPLTFTQPLLLLLVPAAIAFVVLLGRGPADPLVRKVVVGLRILSVVLLLAALAELQLRLVPDGTEVTFVVDRSLSIPDVQQKLELDIVNASRPAMDPRRDRARLVVFGAEAFTEAVVTPDEVVTDVRSALERGHTNIAGALRLALDSFEPGRRRRVVLLSDGNETEGSARAIAAQAASAHTRIDVVPLEYEYEREILVDKLVVPTEAKLGEPFRVRAVLQASRATPAHVTLYRNGAPIEQRSLTLERGANVETFDTTISEPGFHRLTCRVEPVNRDDDTCYQNNEATGFVRLAGHATVLYVHRDAEGARSAPLLDALRSEKIEVTELPGRLLPTNPGDLQQYDAVILDDVPCGELSRAQVDAIEFAVANEGLGLAMIGGESSFGAGDWQDTPVEKALPVLCDPGSTVVRPSLALVLCLDRSGSMSEQTADGKRKIDVAREGALLAARQLAKKDLVGVVGFDDRPAWIAPLKSRAAHGNSLEDSVRALEPGGGTALAPALEACAEALEHADASVKHVVVLTDGLSEPGDFAQVAARFKRDQITVSTVAVGLDADEAFLQRLASFGGGKFYSVKVASGVPRIFLEETKRVARSLIREAAFAPRLVQSGEILSGLGALPTLRGHVLTEAKPNAQVLLVSDEGRPVLATGQHGLGRTLAFTSDAKQRWAAGWLGWNGFVPFWAKAVRSISKAVDEDGFEVKTRVEGSRGHVTLDAVDRQGAFVENLDVAAAVRSPQDERSEVKLRQVGPGRYEGDFAVNDIGVYAVSVRTKDRAGPARHALTTGLVVPYSEEYRKRTSNRPLLEEIARATGGAVVEPHIALDGPGPRFHGFFHPEFDADAVLVGVWPWLLGAALGLFFIDVALRKFAIESDRARAWLLAMLGPGAPRAEPAPSAATTRLLARKEQVRREEATPSAPPPTTPNAGLPAQPRGDQGPPEVPTSPSSAPHTQRLLDAKRRATNRDRGVEPKKPGVRPDSS